MFTIIGTLAGIIGAVGYLLYAISVYKGESKPGRMTWFILSGLSSMILYANFELSANTTMGVLLANAVGSLVIFLLSIKHGHAGWELHDEIAFGGLVVTVLIYLTIHNPLIALLLALLFDFWGLYPTIVKVYSEPMTEAWFPWGVTVFASFLNIIALNPFSVTELSFDTAITPIYLFLINCIVLVLILRPLRKGTPIATTLT